jgi:hypothetical protein
MLCYKCYDAQDRAYRATDVTIQVTLSVIIFGTGGRSIQSHLLERKCRFIAAPSNGRITIISKGKETPRKFSEPGQSGRTLVPNMISTLSN